MSPIYVPGKVVLAQTYVGIDDPDAAVYVAAVEAADTAAGQSGGLETATKVAIHSFVKGCKADGIWPAIKASCILAGARTRTGALVPLVGAAPTSFNFVDANYDRKIGLIGDGTSKYLNSNRNNNADPQDSCHNAVYIVSVTTGTQVYIGADAATNSSGTNNIGRTGELFARNRSGNAIGRSAPVAPCLIGSARSVSASFISRVNGANETHINASQAPFNGNMTIFSSGGTGFPSSARLAFYSIGEFLDLAQLDTRVTDLINAFAAAIP
jgi:hypothetical protein